MATLRVMINWVANIHAVINPNTTPIGCRPESGRMMIRTPINPTIAAIQREICGGSCKTQGAAANMSRGAKKLMAVASAWGRRSEERRVGREGRCGVWRYAKEQPEE